MKNINYKTMKKTFDTDNIKAPYAFLYLDSVDENVQLCLNRLNGQSIRIATKSVRCISTLKYLQSKLGQQFSGLMTFQVDEAIHLLNNGFNHCLMGYPQGVSISQGKKIQALTKSGAKLVLMIDSVEQLKTINDLGRILSFSFEVCVDIDLSLKIKKVNFGVFRSPLNNLKSCLELFNLIEDCDYVTCSGVMGYEAQIAGLGDTSGKGRIFDTTIAQLKRISAFSIYRFRKKIVDAAKERFELSFVNGGGSGSLRMTSKDKSVTEVTIGSAFYCPHLFDHYKEPFVPSCGYAVEVSRVPQDGMITCLGGGYVASGALGSDKLPLVHLPKGLAPKQHEMYGEVQTPFSFNPKKINTLNIGDPVFLRHAKSGELLERFNDLHIIRDNKVTETWKTYRGDGLCFL
jgi:D-serine deaminase-like pyridoxal phosphate-dependent protein